MDLKRFMSAGMLTLAVSFGVVGCEEKSNLEKAGEAIDEAVDESANTLDKLGDKVKEATEDK